MRISDWSSDVCSSDLADALEVLLVVVHRRRSAMPAQLHQRGIGRQPVQPCAERAFEAVRGQRLPGADEGVLGQVVGVLAAAARSEEHTSELQSLMRISYAVFCLKKKKQTMRTILV